jgi:hypothetical protein
MSALAPFRPPGWGSVGCRTFVELNLSGALDARHHLGDGVSVSGELCQLRGTPHIFRDKYLPRAVSLPVGTLTYEQDLVLAHPRGMTDN